MSTDRKQQYEPSAREIEMANVVFAAMLYRKSGLDSDRDMLFRIIDAGGERPEHGLVVSEDDPEGVFRKGDLVTEQQRAGYNIPVDPEERLPSCHLSSPGNPCGLCQDCKREETTNEQ